MIKIILFDCEVLRVLEVLEERVIIRERALLHAIYFYIGEYTNYFFSLIKYKLGIKEQNYIFLLTTIN